MASHWAFQRTVLFDQTIKRDFFIAVSRFQYGRGSSRSGRQRTSSTDTRRLVAAAFLAVFPLLQTFQSAVEKATQKKKANKKAKAKQEGRRKQ
jgi:hypothetical protein